MFRIVLFEDITLLCVNASLVPSFCPSDRQHTVAAGPLTLSEREKQYRRSSRGPFTSSAGVPEAGGRVTASLNCTNECVTDEPLSL